MRTPNTLDVIYGQGRPTLFDPAEEFVEASKLHRSLTEVEVPGVRRLAQMPELVEATTRATKEYPQHAPVELPPADLSRFGSIELGSALQRRRSPRRVTTGEPLSIAELGWLCWASDGATGEISAGRLGRTAPSGGALYPRDLYVSVVGGELPEGMYHYHPYRHNLELVNKSTPKTLASLTAQPEDLKDAVAVVVLSGAFWRNRMKYDLRGVRFALLELGHVAQNCLLAANAIGKDALPIGGYFDDELSKLLGLDGLHEAVLHMIVIGKGERNSTGDGAHV